jgi:hypothetical protein
VVPVSSNDAKLRCRIYQAASFCGFVVAIATCSTPLIKGFVFSDAIVVFVARRWTFKLDATEVID